LIAATIQYSLDLYSGLEHLNGGINTSTAALNTLTAALTP
jgi:hypothetical protein